MKKVLVAFILLIAGSCFAQSSPEKQKLLQLSKDKWQWMADKNITKLEPFFHENSKFVHMSGTWKKPKSLTSSKQEVYGIKMPSYMIQPLSFLERPPLYGIASPWKLL